ncbi:MAG: SpoIID/LytB domain-containing protein [Clostridiales bacterium]|nr:SpoIID/LytB domain-containing protein [Clostridiales bacterium]
MKKTAKILILCVLTLSIVLSSAVRQKAEAYTPRFSTIKVGLYCGSNTLPSANLQNVTGLGSGFQFGILDASRQFVPTGAVIQETKISMLRDRNMVYNGAENKYEPGTEGSVVVGCYHIQMNQAYGSYHEALAAAGAYSSGFVKYSGGNFLVCVGNYLSAEEATAAMNANGMTGCAVNCGTSSTVTVVKTGTNTILFEFEYGGTYDLVVMPVSPDGTKCQTWFKGLKYYGAFMYSRKGGEDLTVYNCAELEDYVKGVVPWEMFNYWPLEALKAQAVCARTYVVANIGKHGDYDLCPTEHCQMYQGTSKATAATDAAVDQTAGRFLTYNGQLCTAYYASSDGGATENSENVWPDTVPYLRGVIDPYEAEIASLAPGYNWTVTYTSEELTKRLRSKGYNVGTILSLDITELTNTGNVYKITLTDSNGVSRSFTKGEQIRLILGVKSIRFTINGGSASADIYVNDAGGKISGGLQSSYAIGGSGLKEILGQYKPYAITGSGETVQVGTEQQSSTPGVFVIQGTGHGHNIGMSQWGAYSMAKFHGMTYDQILQFYFTGAIVE